MATFLDQVGGRLSLFLGREFKCSWLEPLRYCRLEINSGLPPRPLSDDEKLLHDLLLKGLWRGYAPFPTFRVEQEIISIYGAPFNIREIPRENRGSIEYRFDSTLPEVYREFKDFLEPWGGSPEDVAFDPENPDNERRLFQKMLQRFDSRLAHCISPQVELASVFSGIGANPFLGQRADFLLTFPNGKALVLEPGDHDDVVQIDLDRKRDRAFQHLGIETLRPRNSDIDGDDFYRDLRERLDGLGVLCFLEEDQTRDEKALAANYLFLLPTLIAQVERILIDFFFLSGLVCREELVIGIHERDLECAEITMFAFLDRLSRLARLYDMELALPKIRILVQRNARYRFGDLNVPIHLLGEMGVQVQRVAELDGVELDLLLDVGIKCNGLTPLRLSTAPCFGAVRKHHQHNQPVRFSFRSMPRSVALSEDNQPLLESFLQDFFRKYALRPGQYPILQNVLAQKATIGLLPTSAGKSICYQLSALLTPGTTIVVDPIVALMTDQVQSLQEQSGIDRVLAWHAGAGLHDQKVAAILSGNIIVFLSPERLLRPNFRDAMQALNAADIYVNYAVIDEAHCVSMWGHDFRPSYLTLERNFKRYCSFQGHTPVTVALTGTASQLVLIDLKRELNIQDMEAIIRPDSFDRPELHFSLVRCSSDDKEETLRTVMTTIAQRLNVQALDRDACGIIFAYIPNELWQLFGSFVGDAEAHVQTVMQDAGGDNVRYGMFSGSPPQDSGLDRRAWEKYKARTLAAFKRGDMRMLFGNTAVGVGIDNEQLNYVINYRMPQSLEAYYQQCGRAGRSEQHSECYLIFSDDQPAITQDWLNRTIPRMPYRRDDLGTVSWFHQGNFPGQKEDCNGAAEVFGTIFGGQESESGLVQVPGNGEDRTERYVSYWLILGVLEDYAVTGMGGNTVYHVRRHSNVKQFLETQDTNALQNHLVDSLHQYFSRYRPVARDEIERAIESRPEERLSARCVGHLVEFIYQQIEYQRRAAIGTMVSFCTEEDVSPERLRDRIGAYFDTSEKFSERLLDMADTAVDAVAVADLLDQIDGFDDVEHLYWETRRLLDERFRADWAAINLYSVIYRDAGQASDAMLQAFDTLVRELDEDTSVNEESAREFLGGLLSSLVRLDQTFGDAVSQGLLAQFFLRLFEQRKTAYMQLLDTIDIPDPHRDIIRLHITNSQMKEIIDARYSRCIG